MNAAALRWIRFILLDVDIQLRLDYICLMLNMNTDSRKTAGVYEIVVYGVALLCGVHCSNEAIRV